MSKRGVTRRLTQPKTLKPNGHVDHEQVRSDLSFSEIPDWLQEFREDLVDERVPEHRDSHASSSHEPSSEHRDGWYRAITVCTLISRKTEIARSVTGRKFQGLLAEDVQVKWYLVQKVLVT